MCVCVCVGVSERAIVHVTCHRVDAAMFFDCDNDSFLLSSLL